MSRVIDACMQTKQVFFFQHRNVKEIEIVFNKEFGNVCDWFVDYKLSTHFGENKTRFTLFSREKNLPELNIPYVR